MSASALALSEVNGKRFGRLVAVAYADSRQRDLGARIPRWQFICDCGASVVAPLFRVRRGAIRSCGCAEKEGERRLLRATNISAYIGQHGRYETVAVSAKLSLVETEYTVATFNRTHTVIDGWIDEEIFERSHIRVIERARDLWRDIKRPTLDYFDSYDPDDDSESFDSERAKCLLKRCRNLVGEPRWRIFENVLRWNEPCGVPGSRLMTPCPESIGATKEIVIGVAEEIARTLIL